MRCRNCGSTDIEDDGVTNIDPVEDGYQGPFPSYRSLREKEKNADWRFFRARMTEAEDKGEKADIYDMWRDFHDLKYGKGGFKCPSLAFEDCQVFAHDPDNYPWDRSMLVWDWWEENKPV